MSWAAHNPEAWTDVCIVGILDKLDRGRGLTQPDREVDREVLIELEAALKSYNIFLALCEWASKEVSAAEGDYWAAWSENAYEREMDSRLARERERER